MNSKLIIYKKALAKALLCCLLIGNSFAAEKIVSTAGYASEIITLLGAEDKLIGVDTTSIFPREVMDNKTKIGYRRNLSAEGILALNPDLILLAPDAAPQNAINQLKNSGIKIFELRDEKSLSGIKSEIKAIAQEINANPEALLQQIEADEQKLAQQQHKSVPAMILLNTGNNGIFALGLESAGDYLLKILHLENAFTFNAHKVLSNEELINNPAEIIFIGARDEVKEALLISKIDKNNQQYQHLTHSKAMQNGCVFAINIASALGFGANTARNANEILEVISDCIK